MKVCRCGHNRNLHTPGGFACIMRWDTYRAMRLGYGAETLHPRIATSGCACVKFRRARWIEEHSPWRHVAVRLWWATPPKIALWIIDHWPIPGRCWCDLWSSYEPIHDPIRQRDYQGQYSCLCDAPLPTDAGVPDGHCYCPPLIKGDHR